MNDLKLLLDELKCDFRRYVDTKVALIRFDMFDRGGRIFSQVIIGLSLAILSFILLLFLSLSIALLIGESLGSIWYGFGIITLFYLLVIFLLIALRKVISRMILGKVVGRLLEDKKDSV